MPAASGISNEDWATLRQAVDALEHPSLAARLTSVIGTPIEEGLKLLPRSWYDKLSTISESVIHRTLDVAVSTLPDDGERWREQSNRNLGLASGAVGGFFGLPGTMVELPFTTMLMLRSIAGIAAREGEDLSSMDARLSCIEVFALGGPSASDDAAETGYFGVRMMMAYHFSAISEAVAKQGLAIRQLPVVAGFVRAVAARFGVAISEKAAFTLVPVLGAAGGAMINGIFMDHYQKIAHGHFVVRRLERKYGQESIRKAYQSVAAATETETDRSPLAARPA